MNNTPHLLPRLLVVLTLLLFCLPLTLRANEADSTSKPPQLRSKPMIGFKAGTMLGGKVDIENVDTLSSYEFLAELDPGMSFGVYYEFSSPVWTTAGLSLDFHKISPADRPETRWLMDIGVVIKSSMRRPNQRFALRPLIGISYGRVPGVEGELSAGSFMIVKLGAETVLFPRTGRFGLTLETCVIASPFGRAFSDDEDDRYDIAARLRPLLRLGVVFR